MSKKVFLDPGHGGNDSGAIGADKLLEKNFNLAVAKKVKEFLLKQGLEVKLSRENDTTLSLEQRTTAANNWNADCFVSIHCNAYNTKAQGIETYSYKEVTNNLATHVHNEILATGAYTINRGTKTAGFYVLKNTKMRATLIELAFIDNVQDANILLSKQIELALGVARGICKHLGIEFKPDNGVGEIIPPPVIDVNTFYRVVCGSFNNRVYAEERQEELKKLGYEETFIVAYKKE